jgi:hypothetical protein
MNRIFATAITAFSFLYIVPGALILFVGMPAKAPASHETPNAQLARDWTRFPPADRATFPRSTGASGTFTDLPRCLEIKRAARQFPKERGMPGTVGQTGLPR